MKNTVVVLETLLFVLNCHTLLDSPHCICLVHRLEVKKPLNVMDSLISITENIMVDISDDYLLFLQNIFPYLAKYLVTDYLLNTLFILSRYIIPSLTL